MNELSLFTGYGGFTLGLRLARIPVRTVAYVEIEPYRQELIKARIRDGYLDDAPIFADIRTFSGLEWLGVVDIITAGFPCQPFSTAGRRKGEADERNLWPDTARVIGEVRPPFALLENAGIHLRKGSLPAYAYTVLADLAEMGYDAIWGVVSARDVGASHLRERWWCLAYPGCEYQHIQQRFHGAESPTGCKGMGDPNLTGLEGRGEPLGESADIWSAWPPGPADTDAWAGILERYPSLEPAVRRVAHGTPHRLDRLKALGDGLVPAVVAEFLRRIA
jgi:DNA (cytosine-5)-methyltransferase 1